jgi:hypothetical protein
VAIALNESASFAGDHRGSGRPFCAGIFLDGAVGLADIDILASDIGIAGR